MCVCARYLELCVGECVDSRFRGEFEVLRRMRCTFVRLTQRSRGERSKGDEWVKGEGTTPAAFPQSISTSNIRPLMR